MAKNKAETTETPKQAAAKTKRAVCLIDNVNLGITCGQVIELETSIVDILVKEGKVDYHADAIAAHQVTED